MSHLAPRLLLACLLCLPVALPAATFTVTSSGDGDDGNCNAHCTLREAVSAANATTAADAIQFAIPGTGPHTIGLASPLVVARPLVIDAGSQPGQVANGHPVEFNAVLAVRLDGSALPVGSALLEARIVTTQPGNPQLVVRGLDLQASVDRIGIRVGTGGRLVLEGSRIHVGGTGVLVEATGNTVTIGGADVAGRVSFDQTLAPVVLLASASNPATLLRNGLYRGYQTAITARRTVEVRDNVFRPGDAQGRSVVLAPDADGTGFTGAGESLVLGNVFGLLGDGSPSGSNRTAILIGAGNGAFSGHVQVGSDAEPNTIAGYTDAGILLAGNGDDSNQLSANHFLVGLGTGQTALDLSLSNAPDGPTANDPLDADSGPNGLLNTPVLQLAERAGLGLPVAVSGQLAGLPSTRFRLRFYGSASAGGSGFGAGQQLLPETLQVETDVNGDASFGPILVSAAADATVITATATLRSGLFELDTSEFSNAQLIVPGTEALTAVVTTNAASGPGSLRAAIDFVNSGGAGVQHQIQFNLPTAQRVIPIDALLPPITRSVLIDGWSQPGSTPNTEPFLLLSNAQIGVTLDADLLFGPALELRGDQSVVRGLAFVGSNGARGVDAAADGVVVAGCWFGQRGSGALDALPREAIRATVGGENLRIGGPEPADRNVFAGTPLALSTFVMDDMVVQNNLFGLRADGTPGQVFNTVARAIDARATSGLIRDNVIGNYGLAAANAGAIRLHSFNGTLIDNAFGESDDRMQVFPLSVAVRIIDGFLISVRGEGRRIANATDAAIVVQQDTLGSSGISLYQTIVASHQGVRVEGIGSNLVDLEANVQVTEGMALDLVAPGDPPHGATPNDPGDGDEGPNQLQNTPELLAIVPSADGVIVSGLLDSLPDTDYELLLCGQSAATASGFGGCERILLRGEPLRTDASGQASFSVNIGDLPPDVSLVSAGVARLDPGGGRESSELSALLPVAALPDSLFADGFE